MGFIYALRSEQEKTKHTSFWAIHFCVRQWKTQMY